MDENLRNQIEAQLPRLREMIRRGRELRDVLEAAPGEPGAIEATRGWQRECGAVVNELSGGSKAHWLSRAYSEAFLMRSAEGRYVDGVSPGEIVGRLLEVLGQALQSLVLMGKGEGGHAAGAAPAPRRFDFVHNRELKPVLEQAYPEAQRALEAGHFDLALLTTCGILEAIVTDALEGRSGGPSERRGDAPIAAWSFEERLAAAEQAGLIRGGWARLPERARRYREATPSPDAPGVGEAEARTARQVLNVVLRDLNPGR